MSDPAAVVARFVAGKRLLARQAFDVHELAVDGDRVAVRATWPRHGRYGRGYEPA